MILLKLFLDCIIDICVLFDLRVFVVWVCCVDFGNSGWFFFFVFNNWFCCNFCLLNFIGSGGMGSWLMRKFLWWWGL